MADFLVWITTFSFISYTPIISYLDWKYHDIGTHKLWLPLIALNIPVLLAGYLTGSYPVELIGISIISSFLWFVLFWKKILPGADFVFLVLISIFLVVNPLTGLPFMLAFSFYLIGFTAATFWYVLLDNLLIKKKWSLTMDKGLPYLVTISCAVIAALVM